MRSQISLEIDGELSELERRMVAAHLERCADCRAFREDVTAFTGELREARLEELEHPIVVRHPGRRVSFARVQIGVAAAVAVVVVGALAQVAGSKPDNSPLLTTPARFGTTGQLEREVRQIVADGRAFGHEQGYDLPI